MSAFLVNLEQILPCLKRQQVLSFTSYNKKLSSLPTKRSNHRWCSIKKAVLKNFAKFTGKHLFRNLFFNKVAGLSF